MTFKRDRPPRNVRRLEDGAIEFHQVAPERARAWALWGTGSAALLGFVLFLWRDWMLELGVAGGIIAYSLARIGSAKTVRFDPARRGVELGDGAFVPADEVGGVFVGEKRPTWYHLFSEASDYHVYLKIGGTRHELVHFDSKLRAMELASELQAVLEGTPASPAPVPPRRSRVMIAAASLALLLLLAFNGAPWLFQPLPAIPNTIARPQDAVERVRERWQEMDRVSLDDRGAAALFYGPHLVQISERRDYPEVAADCPPAHTGANCLWLYVFEGEELAYFGALISDAIPRDWRGELPADVRTIDPPSTFDPTRRAAELRQLALSRRGWDWWLRAPNPY